MSTKRILTDETGVNILSALLEQNGLLASIASNTGGIMPTSLSDISNIVRNGMGSNVFNIGDQINIEWAEKPSGTQYTVPNDIVHFEDVDLKDGEKIPGMYLQWHFCSPFGVQFDAAEAFYYAETELAAGTYNIIVGDNWGKNCKKDEIYQFTLSKPVPAGGQLAGFEGMPDQAPENWRVKTYTNAASTTPIETVTPTKGVNGLNLGTLSFAGDGKLNSMQRTAYGYNRWSQSAIRQYLNSNKEAGKWWTAQHKWDRPPAELATKDGFLTGFSEEFLSCIKKVKVRTALNTVTDSAVGTYEDTYDLFFLPSLEEEFIKPQISGIEGTAWEYWKRACERTTVTPWYKSYADGGQPITYAINSKTSAQTVRLRSAYRSGACSTWYVNSSGYVTYDSYGYATYSLRFAPACVIC